MMGDKRKKEITLSLSLTKDEVKLLRGVVSDLGVQESDCVSLQLKIADAILDSLDGEEE